MNVSYGFLQIKLMFLHFMLFYVAGLYKVHIFMV